MTAAKSCRGNLARAVHDIFASHRSIVERGLQSRRFPGLTEDGFNVAICARADAIASICMTACPVTVRYAASSWCRST